MYLCSPPPCTHPVQFHTCARSSQTGTAQYTASVPSVLYGTRHLTWSHSPGSPLSSASSPIPSCAKREGEDAEEQTSSVMRGGRKVSSLRTVQSERRRSEIAEWTSGRRGRTWGEWEWCLEDESGRMQGAKDKWELERGKNDVGNE
eukprot:659971-Rhodomonas_salina.1